MELMKRAARHRQLGFTLLELFVVIMALVILALAAVFLLGQSR